MNLELYLREGKLRTKSWSQCLRVKSSKHQTPLVSKLASRRCVRSLMWSRDPLSSGKQIILWGISRRWPSPERGSLLDTQWHIRTKRKRGSLSQRYPIAFHRRFCRCVLWRVESWMSTRCRVRVVKGREETVPIGTYWLLPHSIELRRATLNAIYSALFNQ